MDGIEKFCQLWILDLVDSKFAAYFTNDLSQTPVLESAKNDMLYDEMEAQKCAGGSREFANESERTWCTSSCAGSSDNWGLQ